MAALNQGDQIGRNFAYWVIVYFGWLLVIYKSRQIFLASFYPRKSNAIILLKIHLGYIWGDFLTNASGANPTIFEFTAITPAL
jgi:hypothetical protein